MIELVREIRRKAPAEKKPGIKLANQDLLDELVPWYQESNDTVVKTLIKELFILAGTEWQEKLITPAQPQGSPEAENVSGPRYVTRVYRGQTQLVEVAPKSSETNEASATKKVYRGQTVHSS